MSRPKPSQVASDRDRPIVMLAAEHLMGALVADKTVFEIGAGGSTIYLAQRAARVVSIEDNPDWHKAVVERLGELDLEAEVRLVKTQDLARTLDDTGMWDVVFVDCRDQEQRALAIRKAASHTISGGWLIADDYDFPKVGAEVDKLPSQEWDVAVLSGRKMHPMKRQIVKTQTAFCQRRYPG